MIESYGFGKIKIEGYIYRSDVVIFPDRVKSRWRRETGHLLQKEDIQDMLDSNPQALVIGTGASGLMKVADDARKELEERKILYLIKRTPEAVKDFNRLCQIKRTVGAFHLTC